MHIVVVFTSWRVPFAQVVDQVKTFTYGDDEGWQQAKQAALEMINKEAKKWWDESDGDRWVEENPTNNSFEPVTELGQQRAKYELWDGETGFDALIDTESWWK